MGPLSPDKVRHYLELTDQAMAKIKISAPPRSHAHRIAQDFFAMVEAYRKDARHFFDESDLVNAFAAINYAHGWIDAAARLGLFDTGGDDRLFTLAD